MSKNGGALAYEIPIVDGPCTRQGTQIVVGTLTAGVLVANFEVPRRDHKTKTGYQRPVSKSRTNKLSRELSAHRVDLPTSILANLRDYDEGRHLIVRGDRKYLVLGESTLYIVDGQHRTIALEALVEQDPNNWENYLIPFNLMLGATEQEEMEEFYVVNSTAKSVRTDLALDLLKQRAEADPNIMTSLIEGGQHWKVDAQTVVERMSAELPAWRHRIRFSGDPKGTTTVSNTGVVNSLKPLLATPYFSSITIDNQMKILGAFWTGIAKVLPDAFQDPEEYALQKTIGVTVMHGILISAIEYLRSTGNSVIDPDSYEEVLRDPLTDLEGDTADGAVVTGSDFWRSGVHGAAGSYSSNAGRRVLQARLTSALPAPEVEVF